MIFKISKDIKFSNYYKKMNILSSILIFLSYGLIIICGLNPKILSINSVLKPFITDITMINIATPSAIPVKENMEITFKKPSFFFRF